MEKRIFIEELKVLNINLIEELVEEEEDLTGSVWIPVLESKFDKIKY